MKSFLIIGMSTWGTHLCKKLHRLGCEIMIADRDSGAVEEMLRYAVNAKIADCANHEVLESFGVDEFDTCFVCLGGHFSDALEITYALKELGAKKVITEVNRELEIKFMLKNGADQVVYPELDSAARIAVSESSDSIFDAIEIADGYAIYEISVPKAWRGKSVRDLDVRARHRLTVIAARKDGDVTPIVSPEYVFSEEEHLMVMGHLDDIHRVI